MDINQILTDLRAKRDRLDKAIAALEPSTQVFVATELRPALRAEAVAAWAQQAGSASSERLKKRWASGKMGRRKAA